MIEGTRHDAAAVFIACIDGTALERRWGAYDNDARWPDKLALLPGRHRLAVVYSLLKGQRAWWAHVEVNVQAGRRYDILAEPTGESLRVSIVDEAGHRGAAVPATNACR
jgi:hypothetical protein